MAKRFEFRPDKPHSGLLGKLYLTQQQRKRLLKWVLYGAVLLVLSLLQDVILCHLRIFGATTDLVPCGIFLICLIEGSEKGSIFSLIAALLYMFSGFSPGPTSLVLIPAIAIGVCMFRQGYLQWGFRTVLLCMAGALLCYELITFAIGLFLGLTNLSRLLGFVLTAILSLLTVPALYPLVRAIYAVGGEAWKE